jgi:hypothetical protein
MHVIAQVLIKISIRILLIPRIVYQGLCREFLLFSLFAVEITISNVNMNIFLEFFVPLIDFVLLEASSFVIWGILDVPEVFFSSRCAIFQIAYSLVVQRLIYLARIYRALSLSIAMNIAYFAQMVFPKSPILKLSVNFVTIYRNRGICSLQLRFAVIHTPFLNLS